MHRLLSAVGFFLGVYRVVATGGFPPVTSSPGACGPLPADAACAAVFQACVNTRPADTDPLASEVCVAAASCYPESVDTFLSGLSCRVRGPSSNVPPSSSIPRVPDDVYSQLSARGQNVTLDSYSLWFIRVVTAADPSVVPILDRALIKETFDAIAAWTGFCSTLSIPKGNFLDWFQWSSTVSGPTTTCNLVTNCPTTFIPYCQDLAVSCASNSLAVDNPFSISSCVAGAFCWQDGVNSFLQAVTCRFNILNNSNRQAPVGTSVPALASGIIPQSPMTQQNFIDFEYGRLSSIGGGVRYPQVSDVIARWDIIVAWTNFCSTRAVPVNNLSDFLRYSAVALTSTTCSGTPPQPPFCHPDPNASCEQLFQSCVTAANILTDPYSNLNCALAATCRADGVIGFGNAISCAKNTQGRGANPRSYPRLSSDVFSSMSGGDSTVSQQNYIDSFYGALSRLSSPIWPDVSYVIGVWDKVKTWTAFPNGEVPYQNLADFLQYS